MWNDAVDGRWHELNSVECAIAAAFAAGVDLERAMKRAYEDFTMVQRSLHFPACDVYYMTNEEMVGFPQFTDLVRCYEQSKEVEAAAAAWEAGAAARVKHREHDSRRKRNRRIDVDSDDREALRTFASTHIPGV